MTLRDTSIKASNGWHRFGCPGEPQGMRKMVDRNFALSLVYYPPGYSNDLHRHDWAQITFQLAGELNEKIDGIEFDSLGSAIGIKPAGSLHEDRWGAGGAFLLTATMPEERATKYLHGETVGWMPNADHMAAVGLTRLLVHSPPSDHLDIAHDLLAFRRPSQVGSHGGEPPPWLKRVREAIADSPATTRIEEIAEVSGLHRVHIARQFRRYFGTSPSIFRRSQMAARLIGQLAAGEESIIHCALGAGYFDQSHAARSLRSEIGLNLSQTRDLFRC